MPNLPDDPKIWAAILTTAGAIIVAGISIFSASLTTILNHFFSKRNEVNVIKVKKSFELAEQIAERIQKVNSGYEYVKSFWNKNFKHVVNFDEKVAMFDKHANTLYSSELKLINETSKLRHELNDLVSKSWFYLPESVILEVERYTNAGNYSYTSDGGMGIVDDQSNQFFKNLLDHKKVKERQKSYKKLQRKLRKLKI